MAKRTPPPKRTQPSSEMPIEQNFGRAVAGVADEPGTFEGTATEVEDEEVEDVVEQEDGSAIVNLKEEQEEGDPEFDENLAEKLDMTERKAIATDLLYLIDLDKSAREERDKQYADGIKRTGLGNEAPGGAEFSGASRAVHPVLIEGCVDFAARAIKELFPPNGPVRTRIVGEVTDDKIDRAERKRQFMNWQLTGSSRRCVKEYRAELEQLLTQLPLGGSQFQKFWYDHRFERPRVEFVPIDKMHIPFSVADFYSSHRLTHEQDLTRSAWDHRIKAGLYVDVDSAASSLVPDPTAAEAATEKIEGKSSVGFNEDGTRRVYECYVEYSIDKDRLTKGDVASYIITIDESTSDVVGIYRNWDEEDEAYQRLDWIVKWGFIPWRGAYDIGLGHIIGSLAGALIGGVRALLDSAHINNFPGAIKLKGARMSGQDKTVDPTQIQEIEGPVGVDDIRKLAMPLPFNPPSAVLFELVQWLTDQAKGVVATSEEKIADASPQMPMGTALALIEQGSKVFSAIHARLHASQAKALEILHRINGDTLEDSEVVEELGELIVSRKDFQGPIDIQPVSDPAIFSEAQRFAQLQAVMGLSENAVYQRYVKADKVVKRFTQLLGVPNDDELLELPKEAEKLDPVTENMVAALGKQPLRVYPDQEHVAHIQAHLQFALSPMFCANPAMAAPAMPALIAHVKEHIIYLYGQHSLAAVGAAHAVMKVSGPDESLFPRAVAFAERMLSGQLGPLMPQLTQLIEMSQKLAPPPPQPKDPAQVQLEVGMAEVKSRQEQATQLHQRDMRRMDLEDAQQKRNAEIAQDTEREQMTLEAWTTQFNAFQEQMRQAEDNRTTVLIELLKGEISRVQGEMNNQFTAMQDQNKQQFDGFKQQSDQHFQAQNSVRQEAEKAATVGAQELQTLRSTVDTLTQQLTDMRTQQQQAAAAQPAKPRKRVVTPERAPDGSVTRYTLSDEEEPTQQPQGGTLQ